MRKVLPGLSGLVPFPKPESQERDDKLTVECVEGNGRLPAMLSAPHTPLDSFRDSCSPQPRPGPSTVTPQPTSKAPHLA